VLVTLLAVVVALAGPAGAGDSTLLPEPETPPAEVRERAEEILSRAEFQEPEPSLVERAITWLTDRIEDLVGALGGGIGGQAVLGWIALGLLAVLVVGLAVLLLRRARSSEPRDLAAAAVSVELARGAKGWLAAAEEAEAEGRWRLGLRCRYRALAAELITMGVLDEIPGRTTGEHRREVAERAPQAAAAFAGAAELFDRAWYGNRPTGTDERDRFQELAAEVLRRAERPDRRVVDELDLVVAPR
jgi:hypothetical protein